MSTNGIVLRISFSNDQHLTYISFKKLQSRDPLVLYTYKLYVFIMKVYLQRLRLDISGKL